MNSKRILLTLLTLVCAQFLFTAMAEFQELGTTIRIDLYQNATARWTFETRINLTDQVQLEAFTLFVEEQNLNKSNLIQQFSDRFSPLVDRASAYTGRQMRAYDFDVSFKVIPTLTGGYLGLIAYSFMWEGFAVKDKGKLVLGDIFEGGLYLYDGDKLIISIPSNYTLSTVTPVPDQVLGTQIIWLGRRMFDPGSPFLELRTRLIHITIFVSKDRLEVGDTVSVTGLVDPPERLNIVLTHTKPDGATVEQFLSSGSDGTFSGTVRVDQRGTHVVFVRWLGNESLDPAQSNSVSLVVSETPLSLLIDYWPAAVFAVVVVFTAALLYTRRRARMRPAEWEIHPSVQERDEQLILSVLRSRGGTLPQSEIKELTGFSKAKTSFLLKSLQDKGYIWKERWGREFLVHLSEKRT